MSTDVMLDEPAVAEHQSEVAEPQSPIGVERRLTEAGAAERFARLHGADVRFDHRRGRWLRWEVHRWTPDSDDAVIRLFIQFARTWQRHALAILDPEKKAPIIEFAIRLERRATMANVLALARAMKPIADAGDHWDADPYLLGVSNGIVDLRTGILRPGRPEDRITMQTAVAYEARAVCPRWKRFLLEVFADDAALVDFVHRAVGYSLTGDTSEQALFLLYGTGANGKGTLTNTLKRVLGDYAWNMPFSTIEMKDRAAIPNDLAALLSRRFVTASETNDGCRLNEARVKTLTGCDPVTARFLHAEYFMFEPLAKFWLSVNHKPVVRDDSVGFWRRIRLIPFQKTFAITPGLADELRAEGPGILAWAVQGGLAWQRERLSPPPVVLHATNEYERDSDPLAAFVDEACELDSHAEVGASEIYQHYLQWATRHSLSDQERLSATKFGRKMSERFSKLRDRTAGVIYRGLARRTERA